MNQDFNYDETVTVIHAQRYGGEWPPEDFMGFEAWLAEQRAKIPAEFLASAKVEISSETEYDSDYAVIEIAYRRPPTPEEIAERKAESLARVAKEIEWAERQLANAKSRLG